MLTRRIWFVSISLAALLGAVGASEGDYPPPVYVPVILDGVRYEPVEFNRIHRELYVQGIDLHFTINPQDGEFYAFSTEWGYNEYREKQGLPPFSRSGGREGRLGIDVKEVPADPKLMHMSTELNAQLLEACPSPESYYSKNWEHINCDGASLWVTPNVALSDLRTVGLGWNDRISSVQAATGIREEILYEHINFEGATLSVPAGWTYPDLRVYGWNDRASSLWTRV